jgi:hypothetical protein
VAKISLRTASIYCLVIWVAVWCLFMLIRFSGFDIRVIPGIGPILLMALVVSIIGPVVAIGIAGISVIRRARAALNWLILGCSKLVNPRLLCCRLPCRRLHLFYDEAAMMCLTVAGPDAQSSSLEQRGETMSINCHNSVLRGSLAAQLHR